MLLFVAADPMEFAGLQKHCTRIVRLHLPVAWARAADLNGNQIVMIANGAGAKQAAKAVDAAVPRPHGFGSIESQGCGAAAPVGLPETVGASHLQVIISTGFCGALDPALRIGDIFVARSIHGVPIGTPKSSFRYASGNLASIDRVAQTAAEKQKLRAAGADAVEMEAAGVYARAQALGLPFFCVRAVTDLADETFANDFNAALRADGHFGTMQILRFAMLRPVARLPELVRLRKRCRIAARTLGEFLAYCQF
jgi:adenosylhomocysteine nucleosidase